MFNKEAAERLKQIGEQPDYEDEDAQSSDPGVCASEQNGRAEQIGTSQEFEDRDSPRRKAQSAREAARVLQSLDTKARGICFGTASFNCRACAQALTETHHFQQQVSQRLQG